MICGVTLLGGLHHLPGRVTLWAGVAFCHVNVSRWGNPPRWGRVHVTFASAPNSNKNFSTFYLDGLSFFECVEVVQQQHCTAALPEQLTAFGGSFAPIKKTKKKTAMKCCSERRGTLTAKMRHLPAIFSFYVLTTTQQPLEASPRDPGVVSLHVNASYLSTTARPVTSPSWGHPPLCKQTLR